MDDDIATYLGYKGYTIKKENISIEEQQLLRKELNVKPFVPKSSLIKPQPFPIYRESQNKMYVPRFYGIETYGEPDVDIIDDGNLIDLNFNGELREKQKTVVDKFMTHIYKNGCGLLALHTGFGKTICALNIISRLKTKTLIIVHKEFLLRQWIERIEQFLPDAKVGKIQAKVIDIDDKDIVICMLQSLSMKDYPKDMFRSFGFTIYDECHHIGAEVFSRSLLKVVTKYMLGLSATMKRKDGLTKVIKWFLGDIVCKIERKGEDKVLVKAINFESNDEEFNEIATDYRGQIKYTTMIKKICDFNSRTEFIIKILKKLLDENYDQQIMILGHQKRQLQYLYEAINHRTIATVGFYMGGMKEKDLKISEGKKVIIGTYAMAEEGLDIKSLTTLIMATPKVDVTQSVGRILRKKGTEALVIDVVDQHCLFQRHFKKRKTFYRKQKFKIVETDMKGFMEDNWTTIYDPQNTVNAKLSKKSKTTKSKKKDKVQEQLLQGVCLI